MIVATKSIRGKMFDTMYFRNMDEVNRYIDEMKNYEDELTVVAPRVMRVKGQGETYIFEYFPASFVYEEELA